MSRKKEQKRNKKNRKKVSWEKEKRWVRGLKKKRARIIVKRSDLNEFIEKSLIIINKWDDWKK